MVGKWGFALGVTVCLLMGSAAAQSMAFAGAGGPFSGVPGFANFPSFDINQFMPKDPCSCPADKFCPPGGSSAAACLPRTCSNWVQHNCPSAAAALKSISCSQAMAEAAGRMSTSATFDACFNSKDGVLCMQGPGALAVDCTSAGGGQSVNTWNAGNGGSMSSSSSSVGGGSGSTFASTSTNNGGTTTTTSNRAGDSSISSSQTAGSSTASDPAAATTTTTMPAGPGSVQQVQGGAGPGQVIPVQQQQQPQQVRASAGAASVAQGLVMALAGAAVAVVAL